MARPGIASTNEAAWRVSASRIQDASGSRGRRVRANCGPLVPLLHVRDLVEHLLERVDRRRLRRVERGARMEMRQQHGERIGRYGRAACRKWRRRRERRPRLVELLTARPGGQSLNFVAQILSRCRECFVLGA